MLTKNSPDNILTWKIIASEAKRRNQQLLFSLFLLFPYILLFVSIVAFSTESTMSLGERLFTILYIMLVIAGLILLSLVINKIIPYKDRAYVLDDQGITVSKGNKEQRYLWTNLECFYQYGGQQHYSNKYMSKETMEKIDTTNNAITGRMFYLKEKRSGLLSKLYKVFVVVYSRLDNSDQVKSFLGLHLPQKTMRLTTDSGLIIYKFK